MEQQNNTLLNNYDNNLGAIAEIGQLDLTEARSLPEVEVYEHSDFRGRRWRTNLSYLYVGDAWNDIISSIIVVSGTWEFFEARDYFELSQRLGPGIYRNLNGMNIRNDTISSFKAVSL